MGTLDRKAPVTIPRAGVDQCYTASMPQTTEKPGSFYEQLFGHYKAWVAAVGDGEYGRALNSVIALDAQRLAIAYGSAAALEALTAETLQGWQDNPGTDYSIQFNASHSTHSLELVLALAKFHFDPRRAETQHSLESIAAIARQAER